jgi:F-type H+-transporting ATPase subunit gamma
MSDTAASLQRKINSASDLQAVVRTMKALAASSIGQYEQSVRALGDYYRTVELGLNACFSHHELEFINTQRHTPFAEQSIGAIVFGSDQGLVGQFNEVIADYALKTLATFVGKPKIWAVGERVHAHLENPDFPLIGLFSVPTSVKAITPLIGKMLLEYETHHGLSATLTTHPAAVTELTLFYNRRTSGSIYEPMMLRLLPLDTDWQRTLAAPPWPTKNLPEVIGTGSVTLRALISEYLFVSLFRACAESLASENTSRLAAMERADKNINELVDSFHDSFHQLRQSGIDEELFDVISGYEALSK